jgi:hypothetical protein
MDRKVLYGFEAPLYAYAEVERAMRDALDIGVERQRGALRGRIKHLQRLGLIDLKAGKGKRVEYSRAQAAQWLVALLMSQIGLDPTLIVPALKRSWRVVARAVEQATSLEARSGSPAYLVVRPRVMSAGWEQKPPVTIEVLELTADQLDVLRQVDRENWCCTINLTRPLNRLENALPPRG